MALKITSGLYGVFANFMTEKSNSYRLPLPTCYSSHSPLAGKKSPQGNCNTDWSFVLLIWYLCRRQKEKFRSRCETLTTVYVLKDRPLNKYLSCCSPNHLFRIDCLYTDRACCLLIYKATLEATFDIQAKFTYLPYN